MYIAFIKISISLGMPATKKFVKRYILYKMYQFAVTTSHWMPWFAIWVNVEKDSKHSFRNGHICMVTNIEQKDLSPSHIYAIEKAAIIDNWPIYLSAISCATCCYCQTNGYIVNCHWMSISYWIVVISWATCSYCQTNN